MAREPRPKLDSEREAALERELLEYQFLRERAEEDLKIYVSRAFDAGMSVRKIATVLEVSPDTASKWKDIGEQARERRRSGGVDRSGE